jgi:hypothetical protein
MYHTVIADTNGNWTVAGLIASDRAEIASGEVVGLDLSNPSYGWLIFELPAFPGSHYAGGTIGLNPSDVSQFAQYQSNQQ